MLIFAFSAFFAVKKDLLPLRSLRSLR